MALRSGWATRAVHSNWDRGRHGSLFRRRGKAIHKGFVLGALKGPRLMLGVVIAPHDSERGLLPPLAALVAGAAAGIVREVIVADAGSRDATAAIADGAGCRVLVSAER